MKNEKGDNFVNGIKYLDLLGDPVKNLVFCDVPGLCPHIPDPCPIYERGEGHQIRTARQTVSQHNRYDGANVLHRVFNYPRSVDTQYVHEK